MLLSIEREDCGADRLRLETSAESRSFALSTRVKRVRIPV